MPQDQSETNGKSMTLESLQADLKAHLCTNPIFIIGSPRSGTTALARALAQHSQLWTSEESAILVDLFGGGQLDRHYQRVGTPGGCWLQKHGVGKREFLGFLGLGLNGLFTNISEGKRWVDHTPRHTLLVDDLAFMFPGALFLHILRDGRRVVHSMINYKLTVAPWSKDFREACKTWNQYVSFALDAESRYPFRYLTVKNEHLILDTEKIFEKIFEFIGVEFEIEPVNFMINNKVNSSFGHNNKNRLSQLSEPWLVWSEEQHGVFREEAWNTLVECGCVAKVEQDLS